jgi:NAD(P)-dependent dehydrogenase (short-subunit alcohol dehydrogenase family)
MNDFLAGKVAAVTGGTRGIGLEIVRQLAEAGAEVHACGRTEASLIAARNALSTHKVHGSVVDLRVKERVDAWFSEIDARGRLDILVNNAGIGRFASVAELTEADWRSTIDLNLTAVFWCTQQALRLFARNPGGFVVNVASLAARNPFAGGAAYNASKFGLLGFSEALMLDHRHDRVRVSTILPGSVATEFRPRSGGPDDSWKIAPEDVAQAVLDVLRMPERSLVSHVEIRPSRPPRR